MSAISFILAEDLTSPTSSCALASCGGQLFLPGFSRSFVRFYEDEARARLAEGLRAGEADASAATGDHGKLVLNPEFVQIHVRPPRHGYLI